MLYIYIILTNLSSTIINNIYINSDNGERTNYDPRRI